MESNLQEIKAEVNSSRIKLSQLTVTVNNVQAAKHNKQTKDKFNSLFQTEIPLDLTLSTSFGMKAAKAKACKI